MEKSYRQEVSGHARVTGMINEVHGGVHFGVGNNTSAPSVDDLPALIDALRGEVAARRQKGEIEPVFAEALTANLDEAKRHLPVKDDKSKSGFLVAMQQAKGLAAGLADLTAKVGQAIAAVQGIA